MAFLLDTNIISELRRNDRAAAGVLKWRRSVAFEEIYISVLVLGEMRRGVELKRRRDPVSARVFEKWLREVETVYRERVLPITREICDIWGRTSVDIAISPVDGLIAATAIHHELTVVTRNEADFQRIGVDFFNPFTGGKP